MYSSTISIMLEASRRASQGLIRDLRNVQQLTITAKGYGDFVSAADQRSENTIREILTHARPTYSLLMEESGMIKGTEPHYCWVIDPLDGTSNFLHQLPFFCVAIALVQTMQNGKKEVVAAVIEAPLFQISFWAEKGKGAWSESHHSMSAAPTGSRQRLRVSQRSSLSESLLDVASFNLNHTYTGRILEALKGRIGTVRGLGSSALGLAYVAAGHIDAYVQVGDRPWDIAGGILLVKEAGGIVTDTLGNEVNLEVGNIVASNDKIHKELLPPLAQLL